MSTNEKSNTEKMQEKFADKEMSAEQLENVSGGDYTELADDSEFLNRLLRGRPGQCKRYTHSDFDDESFFRSMRNRPIIDEIAAAWAAVGIRFEGKVDIDTDNRYFNMETGAEMNRHDAVRHAQLFIYNQSSHRTRRPRHH